MGRADHAPARVHLIAIRPKVVMAFLVRYWVWQLGVLRGIFKNDCGIPPSRR
ncbi:MAG: hypothetical protein GTN81_06365 [Proteobacteria bacterium]|nr:hypothetical protein [Pseudomonadota bacterium]